MRKSYELLSSGQQQRVALARALAIAPDALLLLDNNSELIDAGLVQTMTKVAAYFAHHDNIQKVLQTRSRFLRCVNLYFSL